MDAYVSDYAEHLTGADLRLLSEVAPVPGGAAALLDRDPAAIEALLADPRVFEAIFGPAAVAAGRTVVVSAFPAFGVAVHRAVADLSAMDYLPERSGPRQRVPVFDPPELRDFLGSASRRLFLAELLASFTQVTSGRYRVQSGGRPRVRRFSELDPVRLAGVLNAARRNPGRHLPQAGRCIAVLGRRVSRLRGRPRPRPAGCLPAVALSAGSPRRT